MTRQEKIMEKLITEMGIAIFYREQYNKANNNDKANYYYKTLEEYTVKCEMVIEILIDVFNYKYEKIEEKIKTFYDFKDKNVVENVLQDFRIFANVHNNEI